MPCHWLCSYAVSRTAAACFVAEACLERSAPQACSRVAPVSNSCHVVSNKAANVQHIGLSSETCHRAKLALSMLPAHKCARVLLLVEGGCLSGGPQLCVPDKVFVWCAGG
jgi:hypothetical protein